MRRRFPSISAVEFRCCEISLVISCITRQDDFSTRSHRAVSLQVVPFLRYGKGRSYLRGRRAGQTERKTSEFTVIWFKFISNRYFNKEISAAMPWDPFRSKMITDITIVNDYFVCIDFHTALGFTVTFVFLYLSRRSAVITMTLLLLVSWGQGVDGSWDGFSES